MVMILYFVYKVIYGTHDHLNQLTFPPVCKFFHIWNEKLMKTTISITTFSFSASDGKKPIKGPAILSVVCTELDFLNSSGAFSL
jgi:hypothetical protein